MSRRAVVLVMGCALLAGCSSGGGEADAARTAHREPVPVAIAAVVRRDVPLTVQAIGNVEAYSSVSLRSQLDGQLAEVRFQEGQEVRRDDLLFVVDPRPFEAALHEAEATLAKNRADAANAAVEAGRFARLIASGVVSRDEYDQARTRAATLAAAAKADEAAVEAARLRLGYCYIRAPIDGRIGQLLVHAGNVVKNNDTVLAVINQVQPIYVDFAVPQQDLAAIRAHMAAGPLAVAATVPNDAAHPIAGELSFVNNTVDTTTGTVLLKGLFPNRDEALWPGLFVDVALELATEHGALLVPARAVQAGQAGKFVYVVKTDQTVASRPVEVGDAVGDDVVIRRGLAAGERVVTDGQLRLAPGMPVEAKEVAPTPPPPAS